MKKFILTSVIFLFFVFNTLAQLDFVSFMQYGVTYLAQEDVNNSNKELYYEVRGKYVRPVKKGKISEAKLLRDVIPGYPVNWISNYVGVEISATKEGKIIKTVSTSETLTPEQKNILRGADMGSDIVVTVWYSYNHPLTHVIENNEIHTTVTVVPDKEAEYIGLSPDSKAEYIGGYGKLKKYLNENCISKVYTTIPKQFQKGIVSFTVNENGEPTNAKVSMSSGDAKMDKLLLDTVNKMPKWRPAENSEGEKVKQEFEFSVGAGGC